jgi:hypothetical protein
MAGRPYVQAGIGEPPVRMISSILADQTSAYQLANLVVARWGDDSAWESPTVIVRHQLLSPAERADVAALDPGDELITGGMGVAPGTPGAGRWRVEGWQETWDRGDGGSILRVQQFAVSDALRWRTDPGQLTRTAVTLLSPPTVEFLPWDYQVIRLRYDTVPADGQPPERPMTSGTVTVWVGEDVYDRRQFSGAPTTVTLNTVLGVGVHTVRVVYDGVWGVWADSEATVTVTVTPGQPNLALEASGPGTVGSGVWVLVRGGPVWEPARLEQAEEGAPDEWASLRTIKINEWVNLGRVDRPLRLRAVYEGGPNFQPGVSNVLTIGYSWQLVADQHPTWQDVADTRTDWADVAARG